MFTQLRQSERLWGSIYALVHFLVMPELFSWLGAWLQLPAWVSSVCIIFLNALFSLLIYRRFLRDSWRDFQSKWLRIFLFAGMGLLLYYSMSDLYLWLISALQPAYQNLNDSNVTAYLQSGGIFMILAVTVAAPIGEEAIFRGLVFRGLYDRSPIAAWCASIGLFALIHVTGYIGLYSPIFLLLAFVQYLPAGICLALAYHLSGSFFCPLLIHIAINLFAIASL